MLFGCCCCCSEVIGGICSIVQPCTQCFLVEPSAPRTAPPHCSPRDIDVLLFWNTALQACLSSPSCSVKKCFPCVSSYTITCNFLHSDWKVVTATFTLLFVGILKWLTLPITMIIVNVTILTKIILTIMTITNINTHPNCLFTSTCYIYNWTKTLELKSRLNRHILSLRFWFLNLTVWTLPVPCLTIPGWCCQRTEESFLASSVHGAIILVVTVVHIYVYEHLIECNSGSSSVW